MGYLSAGGASSSHPMAKKMPRTNRSTDIISPPHFALLISSPTRSFSLASRSVSGVLFKTSYSNPSRAATVLHPFAASRACECARARVREGALKSQAASEKGEQESQERDAGERLKASETGKERECDSQL